MATERRQKRLKGDDKLTVRQDVPRSKRDPEFKVAQRLSGDTRRAWSQSHPERFETVQDLYGTSMSVGQIYDAKGWNKKIPPEVTADPEHDLHGDAGAPVPSVMDRQLPGFEDPQAASEPPRWEDMPLRQRLNIEAQVLAKTGATTKSMTEALGSQMDQAHYRADMQGLDHPVGANFYDPGSEVGTAVDESAREAQVTTNTMLNMMGVTSPNVLFRTEDEVSGAVGFPNLRASVRASAMEQRNPDVDIGDPQKPAPHEMTDAFIQDENLGSVGYPANIRKAATLSRVERTEGPAAADPKQLFVTKSGDVGGMGPKTGPFVNSFRPSHPDFTVADIHTGGGGALAHLSKVSPNPTEGEKSPAEEALGITGVHSMIDYSMRQAMSQRGLPSIRQAQAGQWAEERYQSKTATKRERSTVDALGPEKAVIHPDQFTLFDEGSYD